MDYLTQRHQEWFELHPTKDAQACATALSDLCQGAAQGIDSKEARPFTGSVSNETFELRRKALLTPVVRGTILSHQSKADAATVRAYVELKPPASWLIALGASGVLGAFLGMVVAELLLAIAYGAQSETLSTSQAVFGSSINAVALIYATVSMSSSCLLIACLTWLLVRLPSQRHKKAILTILCQCLSVPPNLATHHQTTAWKWLVGGMVTGIAVFFVSAQSMEAQLWQMWKGGQYDAAQLIAQPAVDISSEFLGDKSIVTSHARFFLAECQRRDGKKPHQAEENLETNLNQTELMGGDLAFAVENLFAMARVLDQEGHHADAEGKYQEGLDKLYDAKAQDLRFAKILNRLAMVLVRDRSDEENLPASERYQQWATEIDQTQGQVGARALGQDLNDLAIIYCEQGRLDDAESCLRQALKQKQEALGKSSFSTGTTLYNLAEVARMKDKNADTTKLTQEAKQIYGNIMHAEPVNLDDNMQTYTAIITKTKPDYEVPNIESRFDGLLPYLGRY